MNEGLSVHPSILPFGSFLGIGSLFFSETQHCVRGPCVVVCDRARFFERKVCSKNGPMIMCFEFIGKYSQLLFSEFGPERKLILFAVFLHKSHTWEKFGS